MIWANFLHIYQPPTQKREIVEKVADEAYRKIVNVLKLYPEAKITLNISGVLTEKLQKYGLTDIIDGITDLAENNQVEFTGSAKYHPILPLIPEKEIIRQIKLNEKTNQEILGSIYDPVGFFPPEMCYSRKVGELVEKLGYKWIIIDDLAQKGKIGSSFKNSTFTLENSTLHVFFKERQISSGLTYGRFPSGKEFTKQIKNATTNTYLLTGTDGEIYGHHRKGQERLLEDVYKSGTIRTSTISELTEHFSHEEHVEPLPSSWSTWEDELTADIPYPQWNYPGNVIHQNLWKLVDLVVNALQDFETEGNLSADSRRLLDEGLQSDQWWWASCRPWWDVGMIREGSFRLLNALRGMKEIVNSDNIEEAEHIVKNTLQYAQNLNDNGDAKRLQREYTETHREVTNLLTFG